MTKDKLVSITALCLAAAGVLAVGCDGRRRDWGSCYSEACAEGSVCNSSYRCVPQPPRLDAGAPDGSTSLDVDSALDVRGPDLAAAETTKIDVVADVSPPEVEDVAVPVEPDAAEDVAMGVEVAVDSVVDQVVDTRVPDAPGSCNTDDDCPSRDLPFCLDKTCVACKTGDQCRGGAPICSATHTCVSCGAADGGCPSAVPVCEADSGRCVECRGDGDCTASPSRSFCVAEKCAGCAAAVPGACAARDASKPACIDPGVCVECASNTDCSGSRPICDTSAHLCKRCESDAECEALPTGPGVCVAGQDGHCATDAETLYVGGSGAARCSDSQDAGSAAIPFCTLQPAVTAAKRRAIPLLVLGGSLAGGFTGVALTAPLTMVGKGAVITPAPGADGIGIVSGELTLRGITVRGSAATSTGIGINAAATTGNAVILRMDTCAVTDNPGGGIFVNGAAFVINNTTISRNGPSSTGWGGMAVQNPPAGGPTTLSQVTISDNLQVGLACSASLGTSNAVSGVLARGNVGGVDISSTCGVQSCAAGSAGCGAQ